MYLSYLYLRDFRNHEEACIEFSKGINNIYGPNARGKTNLLEAIYFLIVGRSFRLHSSKELIRFGAKVFHLEVHFVKNSIMQRLSLSVSGKKHKIEHNCTPYSSLTSLLGLLQGVVLTPEDTHLISGSPILRRRYLDIQTAQIDPLYVYHLSRYVRAMRQRNALLRQKKISTIDAWEHEMAKAATYIVGKRQQAVKDLNEKVCLIQKFLSSGEDNMALSYKTSVPMDKEEKAKIHDYYMRQYERCRLREMSLGYTITGPHRDDMMITIDEKEARLHASAGQKSCCAISLRLAEWQRLNSYVAQTPIMAIDDIDGSLDPSRKKAIGSYLSELGQVFITSTEKLSFLNSHPIEVGGSVKTVSEVKM